VPVQSQSGGFSGGFGRKMLQLNSGFNSGFGDNSNSRYASADAQAEAISSGNGQAFAQAMAVAFHNGGSEARSYANAISDGIRRHGCGFYQTVIAQVHLLFFMHKLETVADSKRLLSAWFQQFLSALPMKEQGE